MEITCRIGASLAAIAIAITLSAADCDGGPTGDRNPRPPTPTSTEKPLQTGRQKP